MKLKGFPTDISDYIELPDMAELLTFPFFSGCQIDTFLKLCSPFQRKLFNNAPIRGDKKNIHVYSVVKVLSPNLSPVHKEGGDPYAWHIDQRNLTNPQNRFHLLISDCHSRTEFNTNSKIEIENINKFEKFTQFNEYINVNQATLGLQGRKIEPNRFVSFEDHIHRAVPADRMEFRFFFMVEETDEEFSSNNHVINHSTSYRLSDRSQINTLVRSNGVLYIDYNQIHKNTRGEK